MDFAEVAFRRTSPEIVSGEAGTIVASQGFLQAAVFFSGSLADRP